MNTFSLRSVSVGLSIGAILAALLILPTASPAQPTNTLTGYGAMSYDPTQTGIYNTVDGFFGLHNNLSGSYNSVLGAEAMATNLSGSYNTAVGYEALYDISYGQYNVANGVMALWSNSNGNFNTANGSFALYNNRGSKNVANGFNSLYSNNEGAENTANGNGALYANSSGSSNTADGYLALYAVTSGSNNIALGANAGYSITTGSFNIDIGNEAAGADTGIIRIGAKGNQTAAYIAGIDGVTATGGVAVYINSNGQLGTLTSSRRFKFDIKDIGAKSDKLMDLRPVTFRYKEPTTDGTHPIQYGLIAEEVAKVYPDLVQYDKQGKPFTVYYHLLTPIMLNEIQKAHLQIKGQQTELSSFRQAMLSDKSAANIQNSALEAHVASMQHTIEILLVAVAGIALAALTGGAYVLSSRTRRLPLWHSGPADAPA